MTKIRTRIAPSPTGNLHIGTARTALFNYLFAYKNNGKFAIRIEDTDKDRSKIEFEKDIFDGLEWLGLVSSSTIIIRQSERTDIYKKYLNKLLEKNLAYKCFCSIEELEKIRQKQKNKGISPIYSGNCSKLKETNVLNNYVIRFRVEDALKKSNEVVFSDLIRGKIKSKINLIGDFVIAKIKNKTVLPLYNFAVVVDDYEMDISHIIRGEDHIPNTSKQILIQKALGLPSLKYAHLPLILGSDRSKMSKRSGATSVLFYKKEGYLPEALINFMAFLGWNPKDEREFFLVKDLVKEFSFEKIQKSGAIFNIEKLDYINGYYIRKKPLKELSEIAIPYLIKSGLIHTISTSTIIDFRKFIITETSKEVGFSYLKKIIGSYQDRLKKISEISELTNYFFKNKLSYKKDLFIWANSTYENVIKSLKFTKTFICDNIKEEDFNKDKLKALIFAKILEFNLSIDIPKKSLNNKGYILWPLRVALTAQKASLGPFEIAEIIGKKNTIKRIEEAILFLEKS